MAKTPNVETTPSLTDLLRPLALMAIGAEGVHEVSRAREKHGSNADLAFGTGPAAEGIAKLLGMSASRMTNAAFEDMVKAVNDYGMSHGRTHTRAGVLLEEVVEAIATDNNADLRTELVQVIAMAQDWVADIDALGR